MRTDVISKELIGISLERFGKAEVGHVHFWGDVDIPFPRPVHDYLLDHGLAVQHRWVPNSGWTTFRIRGDKDIEHAIWLMRLSYIRYAVKFEVDPRRFLEAEAERHHLGPDLFTILSRFIPGTAGLKKAEGIPA